MEFPKGGVLGKHRRYVYENGGHWERKFKTGLRSGGRDGRGGLSIQKLYAKTTWELFSKLIKI